MTLKRLLALLLAVLMVFSLLTVLTACDSEDDDDRSSSRRDDDDDEDEDEDEDDDDGKPATVDLDDLEWEVTDSGVKLTDYTGDETYVILPDTIEGKKVVSIGNAFAGNVTVEVLVLGKYVEILDFDKINECDSLVRLEGPGVVRTDGYFHVENLEELILPELEELDVYDIQDAENLRYLDISGVEVIITAHNDCEYIICWPESLEEVVIPEDLTYVRYGVEELEDHPYEPFCVLANADYPDEEEEDWDEFDYAPAFGEFGDEDKAHIYCNFFQHDTIIVNGETYELD